MTMICGTERKEGVDIYNTPTLEAIEIIQQLQEDLNNIIEIIRQEEMNTC